jgi:hypothetical protein
MNGRRESAAQYRNDGALLRRKVERENPAEILKRIFAKANTQSGSH